MIDLFPKASGLPPSLLTLAEIKAALRIDHDGDDARLPGLALAAQQAVESRASVMLTEREMVARADVWDNWRLWVGPVTAVVVGYTDEAGGEQTLDPAAYSLIDDCGPTVVRLANGFSAPAMLAGSRITITATVGYAPGECPADMRGVVEMLAARLYDSPEMVVDDQAARAIDWLIAPFRIGRNIG